MQPVDFLRITQAVHHLEVVGRTAYEVGQPEVFVDGRKEFLDSVFVGTAVVQVVVQDGVPAAGVFQKRFDLRTDVGIEGIIGAELYDVVGFHRGVDEILQRARRLFVEHVMGIVPFVEEGQRHGGLDVAAHPQVTGVHMVGVQEVRDSPSHLVVSRFADENGRDARPSDGNDTVERRAARNGSRRLCSVKDNVHDGFAHPDDFAHDGKCYMKFVAKVQLRT